MQLVILGDEPLFFAARDDPWLPTLRLLHKYPLMMNRLRVDTGAIKFVLSGANIMCPGLTSPGATIHTEVPSLTQPVESCCAHSSATTQTMADALLLSVQDAAMAPKA